MAVERGSSAVQSGSSDASQPGFVCRWLDVVRMVDAGADGGGGDASGHQAALGVVGDSDYLPVAWLVEEIGFEDGGNVASPLPCRTRVVVAGCEALLEAGGRQLLSGEFVESADNAFPLLLLGMVMVRVRRLALFVQAGQAWWPALYALQL